MVTKLLSTSEVIDDHASALSAPQSYVRRMTYQRWLRVIAVWIERSRQRRALADLDDHLLDDIGITRSEAAREIAKPFWRQSQAHYNEAMRLRPGVPGSALQQCHPARKQGRA